MYKKSKRLPALPAPSQDMLTVFYCLYNTCTSIYIDFRSAISAIYASFRRVSP